MRIDHVVTFVSAVALAACGSADGSPTQDAAPRPATSPAPSSPAATAPAPVAPTPQRQPLPHVEDPPYPIVLMHGMAGFDKLTLPVDVTYFNGVIDDLAKRGETQVFVTVAPPYDSSEDRAAAIAPQIQAILAKTGKRKVNLVGHSQGGMDARVLASPSGLAMGDVIASVTTIATPHRGSRVADLVLGLLKDIPPDVVDAVTTAVLDLLEITAYDLQSDPHLRAQLMELSEHYATNVFNPKYVDDDRVAYASYGGRTNFEDGKDDCGSAKFADDPSKVGGAQPMLLPTAIFLEDGSGVTNDGLVTVESARWGTFLQCVPADHLQEVGQLFEDGAQPLTDFDHLAFFREVVARIRAAGR